MVPDLEARLVRDAVEPVVERAAERDAAAVAVGANDGAGDVGAWVDVDERGEGRCEGLLQRCCCGLVTGLCVVRNVFVALGAEHVGVAAIAADLGLQEVAAAVLDSERAAVEALPDRLVTVYLAIKALGPTHAGDQRLLDRTGTSRSRITHSL